MYIRQRGMIWELLKGTNTGHHTGMYKTNNKYQHTTRIQLLRSVREELLHHLKRISIDSNHKT